MPFVPPELSAIVGGKASGVARAKTAQLRAAQVTTLHLSGMSLAAIAVQLGVSTRTVWRDLAASEDMRVRTLEILEDAGLDADDIHVKLSQMSDADIADIVINPDDPIEQFQFKPLRQWPAIWRQGLAGKIKIVPVYVRSHDGKSRDGAGGWDRNGYRVEIERADIMKILELAAKLKQVDAMAAQKQELEVNVHAQVTAKLEGALRREQRMLAGDVINVMPDDAK